MGRFSNKVLQLCNLENLKILVVAVFGYRDLYAQWHLSTQHTHVYVNVLSFMTRLLYI